MINNDELVRNSARELEIKIQELINDFNMQFNDYSIIQLTDTTDIQLSDLRLPKKILYAKVRVEINL